jgi:hypothetical protein
VTWLAPIGDILPTTRGHATLLGAPVGDLEDLAPGDVGLVGLFMDHGDERGFGARFAARQIRYASRPAYSMAPPATAPTVARGRLFDLGDLNVFPLEPIRHREALERQFFALLGTGARFIVVGGSMRLEAIMATAARHRPHAAPLHAVVVDGCEPSVAIPPEGHLFATVDLARLFEPAAAGRPKTRMLNAIRALPPERVFAAHLTGLAPELDLSARHDTSAAALMLDALVRHLGAGVGPCH